MAAAKVGMDVRLGTAPKPWAERRIAFHATTTYVSTPAMEPLNEPMGRGGSTEMGGVVAGPHQQNRYGQPHRQQNRYHHFQPGPHHQHQQGQPHRQQQGQQHHHHQQGQQEQHSQLPQNQVNQQKDHFQHPQNQVNQQPFRQPQNQVNKLQYHQRQQNQVNLQEHNQQPQYQVNGNDKFRKSEPHSLPSSMPLQWTAPQKIGAGLSNLGNTCFLNSVLQCLTYTPPLAGYLQSGQHKASCRVAGFCAFCALQEHVQQALASSGKVVSPQKLAKNLRSICRSFRMGRQEDSHEYMRYLLEALHKCCLPPDLAKNSNSKSSQEKSLVYRIFGGQLRSQVKCTVCSHCSNTYDPFLDLSLEIVRADSLPKALSRFTAVDVLDGDNKYRCLQCKKKVRALKHFTIDMVPNILTIQFKRFSSTNGQGGKIDKKVDFGTTLDLKPFVSNGQDIFPKYKLFGVLVHSGASTHSGHYYSFLRASSDIWHVFDDSRVRQVSERTVLDQKAYMLFYVQEGKRVNNPYPEIISKQKQALSQPSTTVLNKVQSNPVFVTSREVLFQPVSFLSKEKGCKSDAEASFKETFSDSAVTTCVETQRNLDPKSIPDVVSSQTGIVVNERMQSQTAVEVVKTKAMPDANGSGLSSSRTVSPVPSTSLAEDTTIQHTLPSVAGCAPAKDTDNSKEMDIDGSCTTSGSLGSKDDWDEYYKKGWNPPGTTPQNFMKLLRIIPHTRRYYQARSLPGRRSGKVLNNGNGELENGQPENVDTSTGNMNNVKRLHTPNEDHQGSKRLQTEQGVYCVSRTHMQLDELNDPIENVETTCTNGKGTFVQDNCWNVSQDKDYESKELILDKFQAHKVDDAVLTEDLTAATVVNSFEKTNGPIDDSNNCLNESRDLRERQESGAEPRADGFVHNFQPFGSREIERTGNHLASKYCSQKREEISNGSTLHNGRNDLYGCGVPRWGEATLDERFVNDMDCLLEEQKNSSFKPDMWDVEYDRGRSKKVRVKNGREMVEMNKNGHGLEKDASNSDNPFQALVMSKQTGNNIYRGVNAIVSKSANGYAVKSGKGGGSDGPL